MTSVFGIVILEKRTINRWHLSLKTCLSFICKTMVQDRSNLAAAKKLQEFLLEHYPNGESMLTCMRNHFYLIEDYETMTELIRRRGLVKFCNDDFPNLLRYDYENDKVFANRTMPSNRKGRKLAALKFYNDHLKGNNVLLRACEDRNRFEKELNIWKDLEQQRGRKYISCSPSEIIHNLEQTHKKLSRISQAMKNI